MGAQAGPKAVYTWAGMKHDDVVISGGGKTANQLIRHDVVEESSAKCQFPQTARLQGVRF